MRKNVFILAFMLTCCMGLAQQPETKQEFPYIRNQINVNIGRIKDTQGMMNHEFFFGYMSSEVMYGINDWLETGLFCSCLRLRSGEINNNQGRLYYPLVLNYGLAAKAHLFPAIINPSFAWADLYCSNMHNWTKINEDNKLYFEIKLYLSNNNTRVTYKHYAKPYHHNFLGWFGCLRTITCSYNNQVVYKDAAGDWPRIGGNQWIPQYPYRWDFQESWTSTSGFETVKYEYDFIHSWMWEYEHPNTGGFGFNVLDARASTLDVGEIHVYCPKQYEIG